MIMQKFYFSRVEKTAVFAEDEEEARLQLADLYQESEDFVLDDVRPAIEVEPGVWKVLK